MKHLRPQDARMVHMYVNSVCLIAQELTTRPDLTLRQLLGLLDDMDADVARARTVLLTGNKVQP